MKNGMMLLSIGLVLAAVGVRAQVTPPPPAPLPPPPWKVPAYPILGVGIGGSPVTVDGVIDLEGEWKDAAVLTGFFQKDLNAVAPAEGQLRFLLKVDAQFLYAAFLCPIYPAGAELTSFEKQPDGVEGIMAGDHVALELLPVKTRDAGRIASAGSFTLLWNALDTLSDQHVNRAPGQPGLEWSSGATVRSRMTKTAWETEIKLPLASLPDLVAKDYITLPPKAGDYWSLGAARRFGRSGGNLFITWDNTPLTVQAAPGENAWAGKPMIRFTDKAVAVQVFELGDLAAGQLDTDIRLFNPDTAAHRVTVELHVQSSQGEKLWAGSETVDAAPGKTITVPHFKTTLKTEPSGSLIFIRIMQDGDRILYLTPGLALVRMDETTRSQYRRSLEILRKR